MKLGKLDLFKLFEEANQGKLLLIHFYFTFSETFYSKVTFFRLLKLRLFLSKKIIHKRL